MSAFRQYSRHAQSPIKGWILTSIALKNILTKRLRTSLTIGGVVLGVGAIVFLVSLAQGLHQTVNQYVIGSRSVKSVDVSSPDTATVPLTRERVTKIGNMAHIDKVAAAYILPAKVSSNSSLTDVVLYGAPNTYIDLSALTTIAGHRDLSSPSEAIVSSSLLDLIGQPNAAKAIGRPITITTTITEDNGTTTAYKKTFTISGVVNISAGVAVYISDTALATAGANATPYGQVKVVATNLASVKTLRQQITGLGLTTASPLDTLNDINTIFTIFTFVVIGFGGIGMVIAILGMFNTLTISLLERTREISLMIIMGARQRDIRKLLMIEALLLSLPGAIGGVIIAWIIGLVTDAILTQYAHGHGIDGTIQAFYISPWLVCVSIIATCIVGLLVALYPAWRASRINPVESLAHD